MKTAYTADERGVHWKKTQDRWAEGTLLGIWFRGCGGRPMWFEATICRNQSSGAKEFGIKPQRISPDFSSDPPKKLEEQAANEKMEYN